jgi:RNA polymerase sigma factor (sigma-70 family)
VNNREAFEARVLPHLDGAYNLARWLLRNDQAAEDAVQDAAMRAFRYFDSLRGDEARPWLLGIVRNTCFSALERTRKGPAHVEFDESDFDASTDESIQTGSEPSSELHRREMCREIDAAIRSLSPLCARSSCSVSSRISTMRRSPRLPACPSAR